jgi:hypothetical protein
VTPAERDVLLCALVVLEELGGDVALTRPLAEMLDRAVDLDDPVVREALAAPFFAEWTVA